MTEETATTTATFPLHQQQQQQQISDVWTHNRNSSFDRLLPCCWPQSANGQLLSLNVAEINADLRHWRPSCLFAEQSAPQPSQLTFVVPPFSTTAHPVTSSSSSLSIDRGGFDRSIDVFNQKLQDDRKFNVGSIDFRRSIDQTVTDKPASSVSRRRSTGDLGNRVKRPMNCFMLWSRLERSKMSKEEPRKSNGEVSKILGQKWKIMSKSEKQPFINMAEIIRQEHMLRHPDYKYRPIRKPKLNERTAKLSYFRISNHQNQLMNLPPLSSPILAAVDDSCVAQHSQSAVGYSVCKLSPPDDDVQASS